MVQTPLDRDSSTNVKPIPDGIGKSWFYTTAGSWVVLRDAKKSKYGSQVTTQSPHPGRLIGPLMGSILCAMAVGGLQTEKLLQDSHCQE